MSHKLAKELVINEEKYILVKINSSVPFNTPIEWSRAFDEALSFFTDFDDKHLALIYRDVFGNFRYKGAPVLVNFLNKLDLSTLTFDRYSFLPIC